jgi:hypothetical protein
VVKKLSWYAFLFCFVYSPTELSFVFRVSFLVSKKSMGYTLERFRLATRKQEIMEKKLQKKLSNAHRGGNELLQQFEDFHSFETGFTDKFLQDSKEKEIMKMIHMQTKLRFMTPSYQDQGEVPLSPFSSSPRSLQQQQQQAKNSKFGEGSFLSDFNKARKHTKQSEESSALITIYEVKWYICAIYRLREIMKRLNNTMIPLSLIRIFLIFYYLIILHFPITSKEFYYLLLIPEIFPKEDICKSSIQEIIMEHIKIGLNITSEDFLSFLENHDFQIPSELLNEIRNNNAIAAAAMLISNSKDENESETDEKQILVKESIISEPESIPKKGFLVDEASLEEPIQMEINPEIIPPIVVESKVEIIEVIQPMKEIEIPESNIVLLSSKAGLLTEDQ